jgi:hypothetical protein
LAAAACQRTPAGTPQTGRPTPRQAVQAFLDAVKAKDLQAMSEVWGNDKGPARDRIPRDELEKRELLMTCYLQHDSAAILGEVPGGDGRRVLTVRLTRGRVNREVPFTAVRGPAERWYMESAAIERVQDFCTELRGP